MVALFAAIPQADAYWGGYCRPCTWGCGYGCYSPCYSCYSPCYSSCCYGSDWYLGVRPGPIRRAVFGPYRWYRGCGYGCGYGCGWGCGYGCYDSCYTTSCCSDGTVVGGTMTPGTGGPTPTPAKKPPVDALPPEPGPGPVDTPPPPAPPKNTMSADSSGVLTVWVPYDAKVTVNGYLTKSSGSRRQFVSYGLQPGMTYKYVVKAEVIRSGQIVEDVRTISLTAGQITAVAFGFNSAPTEQMASAH
jgi:uncharacterized protein (TIGR03000 family)